MIEAPLAGHMVAETSPSQHIKFFLYLIAHLMLQQRNTVFLQVLSRGLKEAMNDAMHVKIHWRLLV